MHKYHPQCIQEHSPLATDSDRETKKNGVKRNCVEQQRQVASDMNKLSSPLIRLILTWCTLEHLVRLTRVCRQWKILICGSSGTGTCPLSVGSINWHLTRLRNLQLDLTPWDAIQRHCALTTRVKLNADRGARGKIRRFMTLVPHATCIDIDMDEFSIHSELSEHWFDACVYPITSLELATFHPSAVDNLVKALVKNQAQLKRLVLIADPGPDWNLPSGHVEASTTHDLMRLLLGPRLHTLKLGHVDCDLDRLVDIWTECLALECFELEGLLLRGTQHRSLSRWVLLPRPHRLVEIVLDLCVDPLIEDGFDPNLYVGLTESGNNGKQLRKLSMTVQPQGEGRDLKFDTDHFVQVMKACQDDLEWLSLAPTVPPSALKTLWSKLNVAHCPKLRRLMLPYGWLIAEQPVDLVDWVHHHPNIYGLTLPPLAVTDDNMVLTAHVLPGHGNFTALHLVNRIKASGGLDKFLGLLLRSAASAQTVNLSILHDDHDHHRSNLTAAAFASVLTQPVTESKDPRLLPAGCVLTLSSRLQHLSLCISDMTLDDDSVSVMLRALPMLGCMHIDCKGVANISLTWATVLAAQRHPCLRQLLIDVADLSRSLGCGSMVSCSEIPVELDAPSHKYVIS